MRKPYNSDEQEVIPSEAIKDAQMLLEFAAQRGLSVDDTIVTGIIKAKHSMASPEMWDEKIDASFWHAYNALAVQVQPVSVNSLKALDKVYEHGLPFLRKLLKYKRISDADRLVNYYRGMTGFFLVMLLLSQVLFSYGTAVVGELNQLPDKIAQIDVEKQKLAEAERATDKEEWLAFSPELGVLTAKKESLERKYRASFKSLEKWLLLISFGLEAEEAEKTSKQVRPTEKLEKETMGKIIMLQDATFVLLVMQSYVLPLFYGFVGACAYILRTLSSEIRNVTFTHESKALYLARFLLGGLAGLAIGWFISPGADSSLKTISPFALAFVAGYGVELLFSVMDRIIKAFSSEGPRKPA